MSRFPTLGDVAESGPEKTIHFLMLPDGEQPAESFLLDLPLRDEARFRALLRRMADSGITNREQFAQVEHNSKLYMFKARDMRLLGFHDRGHLILLTDGAHINGKLARSVLDRSERLREEYKRGKVAPLAAVG